MQSPPQSPTPQPRPASAAAAGEASQPLLHTAFYKFVVLDDPNRIAEICRELTTDLTGSILLAQEGINGMIAGTPAQVDAFEHSLANDARFGGVFAGIVFKRSPCRTVPFRKMKVHVKREIVPLGKTGVDATQTGINVPPAQWRALIDEPDVVLLDNRNSFEFRLGRFRNAIDPKVANFRDFPRYVEEHLDEWKREGKRVAMYCTGGIRCEKTSAWMRDMGVPVYQLEGGILNYFQQMPDAERDWQGECFVFDNRIALDTHLQETDTTLEQVYTGPPDAESEQTDDRWRLERARRLDESR